MRCNPGKEVLRQILFYMLDTKSLVNLSQCSKSLYDLTAAHRFHRRARDVRGVSGIEKALANHQGILGEESLERALQTKLKTRLYDKYGKDIGYKMDTLLQLAWRMKDIEMCRIIKKHADKFDKEMVSEQLEQLINFNGERFDNWVDIPWVKNKIVERFCAELEDSGCRTKEVQAAIKTEMGVKVMRLWPLSVLMLFSEHLVRKICPGVDFLPILVFIIVHILAIFICQKNSVRQLRETDAAAIPYNYKIKLLDKIGREVTDDQKLFLKELEIDKDAQDVDDDDHNCGDKKRHELS